MKLLVTGGAGFIGSAVVRLAIRRGYEVVNLDELTYAACLDNVTPVSNAPGYRFIQADICDRAALDKVFGEYAPDAVMHLAAESHVDRSIDGPGDFIETNVTGTFNLLEAARAYWERNGQPAGFRFHHISTDEVYGSLGDTGIFTEDTPYAPNSPYSASKAASDHLVRAWGETYALPFVITNCSNASAFAAAHIKPVNKPDRISSTTSKCSITRNANMSETGCCRRSTSKTDSTR